MKRILYNAIFGNDDPFRLFKSVINIRTFKDITDKHACLLLHGGSDISPSIYKQKPIQRCQGGWTPSDRDLMEMAMIDRAIKLDIPIIGICRGAQLLCAVDGGSLIQHIDKHVSVDHTIVDVDTGEVVKSNSCHHQMMVPNTKSGARVLALDDRPTTGLNHSNDEITVDKVPEVVFFPQLKAIGIQGHPEWMVGSKFTQYCSSLINKYIL